MGGARLRDPDPASLGDTGSWTEFNRRDLADLEAPELPDGFRFRTADEAGPVEFEPVGTHPGYRRRGLATAMMQHGMRLARDAGARQATVACLGAPGFPNACGLYRGVGFRPFTRDAPLIKPLSG